MKSSAILSQNLQAYRSASNLTQAKLAEKANITVNFLSQLENGNKQPSYEVLDKLAAALNIPVFQLFIDSKDLLGGTTTLSSVKQFLDELSRQIESFSSKLNKTD